MRVATPNMHHGSPCGCLQEQLRHFRWIPAAAEGSTANYIATCVLISSEGPHMPAQQQQINSLTSGFCN